MIVREPKNEEEFEMYFALRYDVLRKPWNQPRGSEKDQSEADGIHAIAIRDKEILGVGRLQDIGNEYGQIRFMAVKSSAQGKGIGKSILTYLENEAKKRNWNHIILEARENAVQFYISCGYVLKGKSHLLFGEIQHFTMEKDL